LASYVGDNAFGGTSQNLHDHTKLIKAILPREKRPPKHHLSKYTANTPDINFFVIPPPGEHDLRGSIIPSTDIAGHLRFLKTGLTEVGDLEMAVLIYQNIAWFQITVDNTSRMQIFKTSLLI
jgi:hypothetical protein